MENENNNSQMKTKPKLKLVTLYLESTKYKQVKTISKKLDCSTSSLIRLSINNFLQTNKTENK
jgi:16S rRNA U516 pseudouridylate synthase RsuA-like enzyme